MSSKLPAWLVLAAKWVQRFWLPCCRCSLWAWFYCQNFLWNKLSNNLANSFVSGIIYVLAQCLDLGPSTRFSSRVCWSATWCYSRKLEWLVKQSDKRWRCPKMPREIQKDWSFSKKNTFKGGRYQFVWNFSTFSIIYQRETYPNWTEH